MAIVGMWLAILGYGLTYAGYLKLGGGNCGVIQAFQGKCGTAKTQSTQTQGQTQQSRLFAQQNQQANLIGTTPIAQA